MAKVLVTGGAGFIGSNFVRYLLDKYPHYHLLVLDALTYAGNLDNLKDVKADPRYQFIKGDIRDPGAVEIAMKEADYVLNFAAETHVDRSIHYAGDFVSTDVYGTFVLLEAMRKFKPRRFVQISTDEVYGDASARPSSEEDALLPRSPYAASKAGADRLAFSYWATYNLPIVISRCTNNYGPYQYPEKLIPLFVTNALEDKPLPVYGTGKNTRDWIYVLDHCEALDLLMHAQGVEGEAFNIGAGNELSVLEITDIILKTLNKPASLIRPVEDRLGHVKRHAVSIDKLHKSFGWKPKTDFEQAIKDTIKWYVDNPAWWQKVKEKQAEYQEFYKKQYGTLK
jgi:dTDP-glucose 4,6-dehydratase